MHFLLRLPCCRLLSPANPTQVLISGLLIISQLARSTDAHYDALAGCRLVSHMPALLQHADATVRARSCNLLGNLCRHRCTAGGASALMCYWVLAQEGCEDGEPLAACAVCRSFPNAASEPLLAAGYCCNH